MVGIKGRSGRKPNDSGWIARAVALYIPSFVSGTKNNKKVYTTASWFRLFKKIYGTRATNIHPYNWQTKIRTMIQKCVIEYTDRNGWWCECTGDRLARWHFQHDHSCNKCGYEPSKLERHRTLAQVRAHTIEPHTPKEELKICPTHGKPLRKESKMVTGVLTMVSKCEECK